MQFKKLTIIVLASTERETLRQTVNLIAENCDAADISELIIFLLSDHCPSASVAKEIISANTYDFPIHCSLQKQPGLPMTVYEIPELVHSSHFLVLGSDMEMDPRSIPQMIAASKAHPAAIVCASKFLPGAKRINYGKLHYLCNRAVNKSLELLLNIKGTELMSFYQIYPKELFDRLNFSNPKNVYYEYRIRPILEGAEYIEIPTDYVRRTDGKSNYNFKKYTDLAITFLCAAYQDRKRIKKSNLKN